MGRKEKRIHLFSYPLCLKILAKIKNKENEPLNILYIL